MAKKRINELNLIDAVDDTVNFAIHDGVQTYRSTALQFKNYCIGALTSTVTAISANVTTLLADSADLRVDVDDLFLRSALTGEIKIWPKAAAPTSYLLCDGAEVSRTTYAALFAEIGVSAGAGDGVTTFNVPDFRGIVPRGVGTQAINARDKIGPALLAKQEDQMQKITGTIDGVRPAGVSRTVSGVYTNSFVSGGNGSTAANSGFNSNLELTFNSANSPNARASATTDGETRVSAIGINFIIKV